MRHDLRPCRLPVIWWPWATQMCGSTVRARKRGLRPGYLWRAEADDSDNEVDKRIQQHQCLLRYSARSALHEGEGRGARRKPTSRREVQGRHWGGAEDALDR